MWREIKAEIVELRSNLTFALNLSLLAVITTASLHGLAELQSQNIPLTQNNSVTNVSGSSSTRFIVEPK
ncbi:MAG: hypothetical protein AAFR62_17030 [Cyanobacteria bacterium J06629_2]